MNEFLYLKPFLIGFFVSFFIIFFLGKIVSRMNEKHIRSLFFVKRFGGIGIIVAFLVAIFSEGRLVISLPIFGMILGSIAILFFGVWDDIVKFHWSTQLIFQCSLGVTLFLCGMRIFSIPIPFFGSFFFDSIPFGYGIGFFILLFWMVLVMNALNWSDGIDGLLAGTTIVSFFVIFLLSQKPEVNQPPIGILSMVMFGAVAGFFVFNAPPSRIFSGTSGSFFIGFALASLSVLSGTKIATALMTLFIPAMDALWVFLERIQSGASPFRGDFRHLHYRLREIGWSDWKILSFYVFFTGIIGGSALFLDASEKIIFFLGACFIFVLFLFWVRKLAHMAKSVRNSVQNL